MNTIGFERSCESRRRTGLTLVELVVVLVILVALASMIIPRADTAAEQSRIDATNESLRRLRDVIVNNYVPDTNGAAFSGVNFLGVSGDGTTSDGMPRNGSVSMPPQLVCLFLNPGLSAYNSTTHFGWHGPYLSSGTSVYPGAGPGTAAARGFLPGSSTTSVFGTAAATASGGGTAYPGDPTVLDAWGNPIVIVPIHDLSYGQYYYALLSAGPSGTLGPAVSAYNASSLGTAGGLLANAIQATISVDTTGLSGISGVAPSGARVLTISSTEYYPYWMPLQ
jgi:type II secretory pathway pseudopilin PulG